MAVEEAEIATACGICQFRQQLDPSTILREDDHWLAAPLLDVPGWAIIMTKRHAEGIWTLTDEEAARLGPMLRDIAGAVKQVTGAERVHHAAMGEVALHYHAAILPRLPGQKPVWESMNMVARAQVDANPDAALNMGKRLREHLNKPPARLAVV